MSVSGYVQIIKLDTAAELSTTPGQLGDYAFAKDVKTYFCFNGAVWKAMGTANPTPPTVVTGSGAGDGATVGLVGSNTDGQITLTQGVGGVASGQIMKLTLANGVSYPNGLAVTFSAGNANFANLLSQLFLTTTNNTVTLNYTGLALGVGMKFIGFYHIGGY